MGDSTTPLIKGMFINSHIKRLRHEKGPDAVLKLAERYGKRIVFTNLEEVPVREEVAILEMVFDLLHEGTPNEQLQGPDRSFAAGRLHLENFLLTPFGKILATAIPKTPEGFKKMLLSARYIATHVFKNANFTAVGSESDVDGLRIIMENNDYPIDHFKGLFFEWMTQWKLENPEVIAVETNPGRYEYKLRWTS